MVWCPAQCDVRKDHHKTVTHGKTLKEGQTGALMIKNFKLFGNDLRPTSF